MAGLCAAAAGAFGLRQDDVFGKPGGLRRAGAGRAPRQGVEFQRQRAFGIIGIKRVEFFGDDQAQHPVAEKFQPLIGKRRMGAGMGERALQKLRIGKMVAEFLFERVQVNRSG